MTGFKGKICRINPKNEEYQEYKGMYLCLDTFDDEAILTELLPAGGDVEVHYSMSNRHYNRTVLLNKDELLHVKLDALVDRKCKVENFEIINNYYITTSSNSKKEVQVSNSTKQEPKYNTTITLNKILESTTFATLKFDVIGDLEDLVCEVIGNDKDIKKQVINENGYKLDLYKEVYIKKYFVTIKRGERILYSRNFKLAKKIETKVKETVKENSEPKHLKTTTKIDLNKLIIDNDLDKEAVNFLLGEQHDIKF